MVADEPDPVTFPVLLRGRLRRENPLCPAAVPWDMIAPHERRAVRNHDEGLDRLAARGGLDPIELLAVLDDRPLPGIGEVEADPKGNLQRAVGELIRRLGAWRSESTQPTAVAVTAVVWVCAVCGHVNHPPAGASPERVQCGFCKVVHRFLHSPTSREDAPAPAGAADSPHVAPTSRTEPPGPEGQAAADEQRGGAVVPDLEGGPPGAGDPDR